MASDDVDKPSAGRPFFQQAQKLADEGQFDSAIDLYVEGLRHDPAAVREGHVALRVVAIKRHSQGGAKPTAEEVGLAPGADHLDTMLHAERLLAKDPGHMAYAETMLRAAVAGGFKPAAKWVADLIFLANNGARKPSVQLYLILKDAYQSIGHLQRAAAACQKALAFSPNDAKLAGEYKKLLARFSEMQRRASQSRSIGQGPEETETAGLGQDLDMELEHLTAADTTRGQNRTGDDPELAKARAFFERAREAAEKSNFDYAIDMYLEGLRFAPDALEDGHLPLCELGLQRRGRGGKKPSVMEKVKRMRGKTPVEQMLNAEYLFAKDPDNLSHAEHMLRAAVEGGFEKTAGWIANLIFQTNNAIEKPSLQTYLLLKDCYSKLGQFDKAVAAIQRAVKLKPHDKQLTDEYKNLTAELTMSKGKYTVEGDFRQSIKDRETQARLYAQDRVIKTQDYRVSAVEDARRALNKNPELPRNVFHLADALADLETDEADAEAIKLLDDAYKERRDFSYKQRAGVIRIRRAKRWLREAKDALENRPGDLQAKAKVEEATKRLNDTELEHYRLCMENYPTNLQAKYEYAVRLLDGQRYNEAIPLLQEAQKDPSRTISAMSKIGYCFFMKGWYNDAIDVLTKAIESYEIKDDAPAKELRYNLARAYEEQGENDKALDVYRRLAQVDFAFKDVSERVDRLRGETA